MKISFTLLLFISFSFFFLFLICNLKEEVSPENDISNVIQMKNIETKKYDLEETISNSFPIMKDKTQIYQLENQILTKEVKYIDSILRRFGPTVRKKKIQERKFLINNFFHSKKKNYKV